MTNIEWTHRPGTKGESWNPVTGCTPISEGCQHCYARRMAKRLAGRFGYPESPHEFDVTLHPDRLEEPLHWRKPRTVFVCSMSDLFHENVPKDFIRGVWYQMLELPQHTFIVLTKRSARMRQLLYGWNAGDRWLRNRVVAPNIWLGVSGENQRRTDERVFDLMRTPAAIRFLSGEPMLAPLYVEPYVRQWEGVPALLDWVVCGFETGPGARPGDVAWPRDTRDQCRAASIPFFWKRGGPGQEIPSDVLVREWPL